MKLCLTAIVKNSGSILVNCLSSWKPYIDSYCIADTGSTDDTVSIITETMCGLDGYFFNDAFEGFSINRNRVLEEAERRFTDTTYFIMIDDSFVLQKGNLLYSFLEKNPHPYYALLIKNEESTYLSGRITTKGMRYKYLIHEVIDTEIKPKVIPECFIQEIRPDTHIERTHARTEFDLTQFEIGLRQHPNDRRLIYYYARTLYQLGRDAEAKPLFERRIQMGGNTYEIYHSMMYLALIEELRCEVTQGWSEVCLFYQIIHEAFPSHAEPLFYEALCHYRQEEHIEAIRCLEQAIQIPMVSTIGVKYTLYEHDIPKMLLRYYYNDQKYTESIQLITNYYDPLYFDFIYESYLRNLLSLSTEFKKGVQLVCYHPDPHFSFPNCPNSFSENTLEAYIDYTSTHQIDDLIVWHRTDRVAYFPNIKRIHFVADEHIKKGSFLEPFPLTNVICQNEEHLTYIATTTLVSNEQKSKLTTNFSFN